MIYLLRAPPAALPMLLAPATLTVLVCRSGLPWPEGRRGEDLADGTRLKEQSDEGMKVWNERGHLERNWQVLDVVRKITEQRGRSMGQVAIAWVLARPAVTSVILGTRTLDQLNNNLAGADMTLGDDETHVLDEVSEPDTPDYTYGEKGQDAAQPPDQRRPFLGPERPVLGPERLSGPDRTLAGHRHHSGNQPATGGTSNLRSGRRSRPTERSSAPT